MKHDGPFQRYACGIAAAIKNRSKSIRGDCRESKKEGESGGE